MYQLRVFVWCMLLLIASSDAEMRGENFTNESVDSVARQHESHADPGTTENVIRDFARYKAHQDSIKNDDDDVDEIDSMRHESHGNITMNDRETNSDDDDDDDENDEKEIPYEFSTYSVQDRETSNVWTIPHELRVNSTKLNGASDSTFSIIESVGNEESVSYEACDSETCIPLCCAIGERLVMEKCIPDDGSYLFPDVYSNATSTSSADKRLNEIFQLIVRDPCEPHGRFLLNPSDYPDDEYVFLMNGSLYQPRQKGFVKPTMYCLAVVNGDKYDVTVCFPKNDTAEIKEPQDFQQTTPVGLIISLPFLLATFLVYSVLPELWTMHGYTLRGYVGSLFVAYLILMVVQMTPQNAITKDTCIALAFLIHFSFLASFFWLNVMCFDIWWTFGGFRSLQGSVKQRERKKFIMYSIYAWGSASVLTGVCAIMDFVPSVPKDLIRPEFGTERCWFTTDAAKAVYFYGPMSITVLCNICLFISTALKIVRHKKDTAHHLRSSESRRHDDNKQWFNLYLKLFIVMGINWSMEIVSWLFKGAPQYIWYLTDLTNTLQGLIIFIIFVWKEKIKRLLLKRFGCQEGGLFSRNSTHSMASRTCTTTSTVIPMQEKISPYVQGNYRAKNSSDETDCP